MVEDILKELQTILSTNLASKLDDQDTKYNAEIPALTLRDVRSDHFFIGKYMTWQSLPALFIIANNTPRLELHFNQFKDVKHNISIVFLETDSKPIYLEKRILRSLRAIENVLEIYFEDLKSNLKLINVKIHTLNIMNIDANTNNIQFKTQRSDLYREGTLDIEILERLNAYKSDQV